jgi:serine/threonine-protein kinase
MLEALADVAEMDAKLAHLDVCPASVIVRSNGSIALTEFSMWDALTPAEAARLRFDRARVAHLSPEIAKSLPGDARSDVFSVGAILYELLSGQRPFTGATQLLVALAIADGRRKPLAEVAPGVPEDLAHVVEAMLALKPEDRFQSARAALNALRACSEPSPEAPNLLASLVKETRAQQAQTPNRQSDPGSGARSARPSFPSVSPPPPTPSTSERTAAWHRPGTPPPPSLQQPHISPEPPVMEPPMLAPPPMLDVAPPAPVEASSGLAARDGKTAFFRRSVSRQHKVPSPLPPPPLAPVAPQLSPPPLHAPALDQVDFPPLLADVAAPALAPMAPPALGTTSPPALLASPGPGATELPGTVGAIASPARPPAAPLTAPSPAQLPPAALLVGHDFGRREDDASFREPSATLFEIKNYASAATSGKRSRLPLGLAVSLALIFGFAAVVGGYLLFRLL